MGEVTNDPRMVEGVVYLQVVPQRSTSGWVKSLRVERHSAQKPKKPLPGGALVKLTYRMDAEAFEPLEPEVVVDIPLSKVHRTPVVTPEDVEDDWADDGLTDTEREADLQAAIARGED